MPDGEYSLVACADATDRVRERDERNNCRSSAGVVVIDTVPPPAPSIDERPAPVALGGDARFAFSSTEAGVRFACALDGAPLVSCTSPVEVDGLDDGEHGFRVVARDAAGNESAPAEASWTVVPRQTTLGDGAWSWFADPRAVHHEGRHRRTYVGWVARDGDVKVSAYDHVTLARTTALIAPAVEVDDHANPAIQVLPDGRVRAYYSAHGGARMWYRTSLAAEDVSAWGPVVHAAGELARLPRVHVPEPCPSRGGGDGRICSGAAATTTRRSRARPTAATTWTPVRTLISVPGSAALREIRRRRQSTIHVGFTNAHPAESSDVNIYYAAYRDGMLRRADGTPIGATRDADHASADADLVFDAPTTRGSTTSHMTRRAGRCSSSPPSPARRTTGTSTRAGPGSAG